MSCNATTTLEPLLDERALSRLIGRSLQQLRRDRQRGIGVPFIKVEKLVRYRPEDVREYLERNRRKTR